MSVQAQVVFIRGFFAAWNTSQMVLDTVDSVEWQSGIVTSNSNIYGPNFNRKPKQQQQQQRWQRYIGRKLKQNKKQRQQHIEKNI